MICNNNGKLHPSTLAPIYLIFFVSTYEYNYVGLTKTMFLFIKQMFQFAFITIYTIF